MRTLIIPTLLGVGTSETEIQTNTHATTNFLCVPVGFLSSLMQTEMSASFIIMDEQQYLFERPAITAEQIFNAYYACRKHKRNTLQAIEFEVNLEQNLIALMEEINNGTYKVGLSTVFIIDKPVKREVFAASFRDRIVHHLVIDMINPLIEKKLIYDCYSCRVNKGSFLGINRLRHFMASATDNWEKEAWILKMDIKGFFMSIDRKLLFSRLKDFLQENYHDATLEIVLELCKKIIFNNPIKHCIYRCSKQKWKGLPDKKSLFKAQKGRGLPIGNYASQIFANFYMSSLDHFIKHNLKIRYYGRYVDDFFLIHENHEYLVNCMHIIESFVENDLHILINPAKTYLQPVSHGVSFLGVNIQTGHTNMSKRLVNNFRTKIQSLNEMSDLRKLNALEMQMLRNSINSYLGFCVHHNTYRLRIKLLNRLDARIKKRINIENYSKISFK